MDLKLKICRGSSVKKILVREAESYSASKLIVGTARNHHTIRSSTSVAKYCAKKLPKSIGVTSVNNGKVVFNREGSPGKNGNSDPQAPPNCLLFASQVMEKPICAVCAPMARNSGDQFCEQSCGDNSDGEEEERGDSSLALVPVKSVEPAPSSLSVLITELPEVRPGWPLLRRVATMPDQKPPERTLVRQISVVQWAMQLPSRNISCDFDHDENQYQPPSNLDSETGAIVLVGGMETTESESHSLPPELEGLHEKYASTCRLFEHRELVASTSGFLPGLSRSSQN